jgi:hypothetical protein
MRHRVMVTLLALTGAAFVLWLTWQGVGYYKLPLADRPFHPQHSDLKPAGHTGIRLGVISLGLFLLLFLYPLRKRVKFLQRIGKTRRWLDFHILLGLTVPLLVTLHSSLKLKGLAGMAYWIMMAIVASGIVGRYLYAQIPRSLNAAELSLREIQEQSEALADQIRSQNVFNEGDLAAVLALPTRQQVEAMPVWQAMVAMALLDLRRPLRVAALRRKTLSSVEHITTLGGLLKSGHAELEAVIGGVRKEAWLTAKVLFLGKTSQVFHLWHVVHRPFSYAFAILVVTHIAIVMLMGYF